MSFDGGCVGLSKVSVNLDVVVDLTCSFVFLKRTFFFDGEIWEGAGTWRVEVVPHAARADFFSRQHGGPKRGEVGVCLQTRGVCTGMVLAYG